MQVPRRNSVTDLNDETLTLLRLLDPRVRSDPNTFYRALREYDPVHWDRYMHAWVVTSYPEVLTVLSEYSAERAPDPDYLDRIGLPMMKPFAEMMRKQMLFMDPPMHGQLRAICASAFTPYRIAALRDSIESVANRLLDKFMSSGRMDLVEDFSIPFPAIVIAMMLGVPIEDHQRLSGWVLALGEMLGNFHHDPERLANTLKRLTEFKNYIATRMEEQRRRTTNGLIHALMTAEVNGHRLDDEQVIATAIITLIGGCETTTNLIASGLLTLLREPTAYAQLRDHPEIIASAVEELLRFESPVQHTARVAPADMQLGGKTIRKGARVVAVLAAANRDPNRFSNPDRLDLLRSDNRHLAFGWAAHFCFGAPLARMEAQVAFNMLLHRLSRCALADTELEWRNNAGLRGLTALNISFDRFVSSAGAR